VEKLLNWIVIALAAICLCANIFNAVTKVELRTLRAEYQQRQIYIGENASYRKLNAELVKALANLAVSSGDEDIRQMLSSEGITYKVNTPPAPVPSPAPVQPSEADQDD
jgi:hypothetical protein